MALLDRVGVDLGDPLVRGEAEKQRDKAMQKNNNKTSEAKV